MKKGLRGGILAMFVLLCVMTVANLVYSTWPCELAGPTSQCNHIATLYCRGICGGTGKCQSVIWNYNFCNDEMCYERYVIICTDGREYSYDCNSNAGFCPK